jgi:hypothetical protein
VIPPTKEQQRQAIRAQLIKEFNAPPPVKRERISGTGLSKRSKFNANLKNKAKKDDDAHDMPAIKKKDKK